MMTSSRSLRRPVRATAALAAALLAPVAAGPATAAAATTAASPQVAPGSCPLPLVHDVYDGFHVGVPSGWDLSTMDSEIAVEPSPSSPEGVILYPALLTGGTTASQVFSGFMAYERRAIQASGGAFGYQVKTGEGGLPEAAVAAELNGAKLSGEATVEVLPLRTKLAAQEALVALDYSSKAAFASEASLLAAVGRCYGPEQGEPFAVFPTNPFTYIMPPGFGPTVDEPNVLELENTAETASASYKLWGPLVQGVNVSQPLDTPAEAIDYWFGQLGFRGATPLSARMVGQDVEYLEFTATLNGNAVHGLMYMDLSASGPSTAGVFRLALAAAGLWDSMNGALIEMAGSIQHDFSQDITDIQEVNRQWQDFSGQVADFDDTLNNQQLVQDPNTGKLYEAPYSSYREGTQGWGYYGPQDQLLNPVQRS